VGIRVVDGKRVTWSQGHRLAFLAAIIGALAFCIRLGPFVLARMGAPVTYTEADLDHDGWVSLTEGAYIFDAGKRHVNTGPLACTEYFALKDGLPIKTVCP
jgi:hypothetical protein